MKKCFVIFDLDCMCVCFEFYGLSIVCVVVVECNSFLNGYINSV